MDYSPDSTYVGLDRATMEALTKRSLFDNPVFSVLGKLWALPWTAVGAAIGLVGLPFGASFDFGNNALQVLNFPKFGYLPEGALTLGNTVIHRGAAPKDVGSPYGPLENIGRHEFAHTLQAQVLGPF